MTVQLFLLTVFWITISSSTRLEGRWNTGLDNSVVEFTTVSGVVSGKIIASDDKKNIGIVVIKSLITLKNSTYTCEVYDPKFQKYFDATLVFLDQNRLQVKVSCCLGLINETYVWKRLGSSTH